MSVSGWPLTGVPDLVCALGRAELVKQRTDAAPHGGDGALVGFAQQRFQLGKHHLDWVQVRAVGWKEQQMRPGLADGATHRHSLVAAQAVENDGVARPQRAGAAEWNRPRYAVFDLDDGQIAEWISPDQLRRDAGAVVEDDIDCAAALDDVVVRHDIAVVGDDEPGPAADRLEIAPAVGEPGEELLVDDGDDGRVDEAAGREPPSVIINRKEPSVLWTIIVIIVVILAVIGLLSVLRGRA